MPADRPLTTRFGLTLSSEEHGPRRLVEQAVAAEAHGFDFVSISDHYHPWVSAQGHAPFVWSVLGALASATDSIDIGVGVTCPTVRIHPAVVAQAVATTGCLLGSRFTWGVGTGEALNEHILGDRWPPGAVRLAMLEEAVEVIRKLLVGDSVTHYGEHFTVEDARLFDVPDPLPPILMSAFGPNAVRLAAEIADGLWTVGGDADLVQRWRDAGGTGPVWTQLTVCWDPDRDTAIDRAWRQWPNTAVPGQLSQDLRTVEHFEQAAESVRRDEIADSIPCGPDLAPIVEAVSGAIEAGADHIYFHQVGDPLDGFMDLWDTELRGAVNELARSAT